MGIISIIALFVGILCSVFAVQDLSNGFQPMKVTLDHRACMDQHCDYVMLWKAVEEGIIIEVQVATMGYVGLGFSDDGQMTGADIVLGWIDEEGQIHLKDCHATGMWTPEVDDIQDCHVLSGYKNETHTVLRFSRPWNTCHDGDFIITGDTIRVIWAYHSELPDPSEKNLPKHEHRGVRSIYLKEPKMNQTPSMEDTSIVTWDVTVSDMILPSDSDTMYWCKIFKRPKLTGKHHFIGYIPLIEESQLSHVHHMMLYQCNLENSEYHMDQWVEQKGAQCQRKNMPLSWTNCEKFIIIWNFGSQGEMLPDHVGYPMGEEHGGADYFMLEIHYTNDNLHRGIKDNSGLRLFMTDQLREYDGGVLSIGHSTDPIMMIPPNNDWSIKAQCDPICTEEGIPASGIKVFSAMLHSHLLGRAIKLQHIRNGQELKPIILDDNYDFNYQQARMMSNEITLLPGDQLIATCVFDSTDIKRVTLGGFSTTDEMCFVNLQYYPKLKHLTQCESKPIISELYEAFGIQVYDEDNISKENIIDENKEIEKLKIMKERFDWQDINYMETKGELKYIKSLKISSPPSQLNRSFYELLMDDETWKNEELLQSLKKVTMMSSRIQTRCNSYNGTFLEREREVGSYVPYKKDDICGENSRHSPQGDLNVISFAMNEIDGKRVREESRIVNNKVEGHTQNNKEQRMENSSSVSDFSILLYAIIVMIQMGIIQRTG